MIPSQFISYLKKQILLCGTQAEFAKQHGVSAAYLSDVLSGKRAPGAKLLDSMDYERLVFYVPKSKLPKWASE